MNFALAIVIYLILFVVLLWGFCRSGMGLFSGLTLTALLAALVLVVLVPPSEIEHQIDLYFKDKPHRHADDYIVLIYLTIMMSTLLLISFFVIMKAYEDKYRRIEVLGEDYLCDFRDYLSFW